MISISFTLRIIIRGRCTIRIRFKVYITKHKNKCIANYNIIFYINIIIIHKSPSYKHINTLNRKIQIYYKKILHKFFNVLQLKN